MGKIEVLRRPDSPKTYLPVVISMILARSLYSSEFLDVRMTQQGADDRGYSLPTAAGALASFAKTHRIDLRSTSTQPANNQPFTFLKQVTRELSVQPKFKARWEWTFDEVVTPIQSMSSATAVALLALTLGLCLKRAPISVEVTADDDFAVLDAVASETAKFVDTKSDNGSIGQAFVAALLDLLYGQDSVSNGHRNDPSRRVPGDVKVVMGDATWLLCEVKQKAVTQGDVEQFIDQVAKFGARAAWFFALRNSNYPNLINPDAVVRVAGKKGVSFLLSLSADEALAMLLPIAPGTYAEVAGGLVEQFIFRMIETDVEDRLVQDYKALIRPLVTVSS